MTRNRSALLVSGLLLAGQLSSPAVGAAQPVYPFYNLVDTAAQRLATADPVAAFKWLKGGLIDDPPRVEQVIGAVTADASGRGIDPNYVTDVFTDQINATEAIEYTRFAQWKFDGSTAPPTAPELSESREKIDKYNKMMVEEIALHWNSLHSQGCGRDLADATAAVAAARALDGLYRQALASATRSYCRPD
jgi:chorismate mutase